MMLREEHLSTRQGRIHFGERVEVPDRDPEQRENGHKEHREGEHRHWT